MNCAGTDVTKTSCARWVATSTVCPTKAAVIGTVKIGAATIWTVDSIYWHKILSVVFKGIIYHIQFKLTAIFLGNRMTSV